MSDSRLVPEPFRSKLPAVRASFVAPRRVDAFPETRWSLVVQAGKPNGKAALAELCANYWSPVHAFLRAQGLSPEDAREHTQDFFTTLLESPDLAKLDPKAPGRFRSWLRTAAKRHFFRRLAAARAQKRGGDVAHVSTDAEDGLQLPAEDQAQLDAERLFNRAWARTIVERALTRLKAEYAESKHSTLAQELLEDVDADARMSDSQLAGKLNVKQGTLRARRSRLNDALKTSFSRHLRREIAETVAHPADIDAEYEALMDALP